MALDAATLALVAAELEENLLDARIDKIHQPTHDEVVLALRTRTQGFRLLLCARTGSARVCLTQETYENPQAPPSFCMLLRKYLGGGRLCGVRTLPGERIAFFDFICTNDMGDVVALTLAAELMGRYCNIVLVRDAFDTGGYVAAGTQRIAPQGQPKIVDALKRVDFEDSEIRQLLPGLDYTLPPPLERMDMLAVPFNDVKMLLLSKDDPAPEVLRRAAGNVGPVVVRELCHRALDADAQRRPANALSEAELAALESALQDMRADYARGGSPTLVRKADGVPVEFSFTPLTQYLPGCTLEEYQGWSVMLEGYYAQKDRGERLRQKSKALRKTVQNLYDRAVRKQAARQEDLAASEDNEHLRIAGELLTANLHAFERGDASVTVQNWYTGAEETLRLDVRLTPSQNAQKYYKEYKKKQTAHKMLEELLKAGAVEIEYLATVLYEVENAEGEVALGEIRAELKSQGYLKYYKQRDKKQKPAGFIRYTSSDGFTIYIGRNNAQNEKLTLKTARGKDMWFHVTKAPGSHVVVMSEGQDIPLQTQNEAAMLAVVHSSQNSGAKVPVDYTMVRNIRKTNDLPPGMVIYDHYETAYVTPDEAVLSKLEKGN